MVVNFATPIRTVRWMEALSARVSQVVADLTAVPAARPRSAGKLLIITFACFVSQRQNNAYLIILKHALSHTSTYWPLSLSLFPQQQWVLWQTIWVLHQWQRPQCCWLRQGQRLWQKVSPDTFICWCLYSWFMSRHMLILYASLSLFSSSTAKNNSSNERCDIDGRCVSGGGNNRGNCNNNSQCK